MKILVTGGAGFIGSHVADALIEKGHEVMIIDNLSTGKKENVNAEARFLKMDLGNFKKTAEIFEEEKFKAVFHLAAQMDVRKSVADPIFDARENILVTLNLLEAAKKGVVKKFIFTSSGGTIYGDTDKRPTPEDYTPKPLSPYGIGKLAVDNYLYYYHQVFGLNYVSLRLGNVYGPRQNPHGEAGVVAIFLNRMLHGEQPIINGDGKQTRDYVYVGDVVEANLLALDREAVGIFNAGTGVETNVNQLFRELNRYFKNVFQEKHEPALPGEQKTSCLLTTRIEQELGWKAQTNLKEGLKRTWKWFKESQNGK